MSQPPSHASTGQRGHGVIKAARWRRAVSSRTAADCAGLDLFARRHRPADAWAGCLRGGGRGVEGEAEPTPRQIAMFNIAWAGSQYERRTRPRRRTRSKLRPEPRLKQRSGAVSVRPRDRPPNRPSGRACARTGPNAHRPPRSGCGPCVQAPPPPPRADNPSPRPPSPESSIGSRAGRPRSSTS